MSIGGCVWARRDAWHQGRLGFALAAAAPGAVGWAGADRSGGTGIEQFAQLHPGVSTGGTCLGAREASAFHRGLGHEEATNLQTGALTLRSGRSTASERSPFAAFSRWRDPDSNRGHHDFQGVVAGDPSPRNACKSACLRSRDPIAMPSVALSFTPIWDSTGASKSHSAEAADVAVIDVALGGASSRTITVSLCRGLVRCSDP
jgi:hypothetical protein